VHETPEELAGPQQLLDDSAAAGGAHLTDIIRTERRLTVAQLCGQLSDPVHGPMLRQAMLDHYLPIQGPSFEEWMDSSDEAIGARIVATKMFTFHMDG
jgi:hypothetical protein